MLTARSIRFCLALGALVSLARAPLPAAVKVVGISLKVLDESVPPGGVAQMKVMITEPKPISTGRGGTTLDAFEFIDGIALISPADDAYGVAAINGRQMDIAMVSPSGTFGTALDYPVLTIAGHVSSQTPVGSTFPMGLDASSLVFLDPNGTAYPIESKPGTLTVGSGVSVDDVRPGGADLLAGDTVRILGTNFTQKTRVRFEEATLASTRFVNSGEIDVVLGTPVRMHGMGIRVRNPGGREVTYYSYQRTTRAGVGTDPIFATLVPVFPYRASLAAAVDLAGDLAGLALQNIEPVSSSVTAGLLNADGVTLSTVTVDLPANTYLVRSIPELFQVSYAPGMVVTIQATSRVQVMGISLDASNRAAPIPAR